MPKNFGLIRQGTSIAVLKEIPMPTLRDDYILVRTVAIALNPTDWTTLDAKGDDGTLVGCDYAGIVEEVGKAVTKSFRKGGRIAGIGHGGNDANPQTGAFARYIAVKGDIQMHVPDHVSFEEAATVGVAVLTAGYALYRVLKLPLPGERKSVVGEPILVHGGSTSTGSIAIQLAQLSGQIVSTTCSPRHFELVKERGATKVYDYRAADIGQQIFDETQGKLTAVLDCVAIESSAAICAAAIGTQGGSYCNLLGIDCPRKDVKSTFFLGYDLAGEEYIFEGDKYPAKPEEFEFGQSWTSTAEKLWADKQWRPHPEKLREGGLLGAIDGMEDMRQNRGPSGEKWVYRVEDTAWP